MGKGLFKKLVTTSVRALVLDHQANIFTRAYEFLQKKHQFCSQEYKFYDEIDPLLRSVEA